MDKQRSSTNVQWITIGLYSAGDKKVMEIIDQRFSKAGISWETEGSVMYAIMVAKEDSSKAIQVIRSIPDFEELGIQLRDE